MKKQCPVFTNLVAIWYMDNISIAEYSDISKDISKNLHENHQAVLHKEFITVVMVVTISP